ncbi:MAG: xanthine dehydrogenase family protein molybdopterin-binding subunit [Rhodospirillaceae bacterium]|jgi:aerobic carbon-monoxide dehydrogenase large subunit|nr:xanthine dehydrogenase family protein molybdopterin-binding subunit [Rhodospirillaceae bacterium]MBT5192313.1 xanthine dehydrogenase family protein molybdopterin-binding subunit [Rhodospirillaceae bacterium]MBT5897135.1 xanthine dehydrogenase family protein molybdopterin-binding subunit [Rhodospirillaceae bacterium]MBT6429563.1 xanthine dehydrogenase family protein molybdopterin-binding subunit [Rhodospirillaceae bacterium]
MTTHKTGIGAPMPRKEDHRFLTGAGRFSDDIVVPEMLVGMFLRASVPHGEIAAIDVAAALAAPGVQAVLTAADIEDEITGPMPSFSNVPPFDVGRRDGGDATEAAQYPLASDRVRYLGEPVAFIVADTLARAQDALELISVDYRNLQAVMEIDDALDPGAEQIWPDAPGNISFEWETGEKATTDAAFDGAHHISRLPLINNRVVINFMEPRAAVASHDPASGRLTLQVGCQAAHGMRAGLAGLLGIAEDDLHVVVPDTGGGFGARAGIYPEFALALIAARRLGQPVKWTASRAESILSDYQARDHIFHGELALDADGRFLGLRVRADWRHGAYFTNRSIWIMCHYLTQVLGGGYRMPVAHLSMRGIVSNTTPHSAYRGVGRLEINYVLERLIHQASIEMDIDPITLRRINLLSVDDLPWRTPGGALITSGAFADNLSRAVELAGWHEAPARRRAAEAEGRLYGIGLAMYAENDGSTPTEFAEVAVAGDGQVTAMLGTQDFGMGHATIFSQILSEKLGVDFEDIDVVFGDSDRVKRGAGTHGSRSTRMGGTAAYMGAEKVIVRARGEAAEMLEAAPSDIEFADGRFTIAGTDRGVSLYEVATHIEAGGGSLAEEADFNVEEEVISNGVHICELTVDPADGSLRLENYHVVADVGRIVNPVLVHGQLHGGVTQGIGQALFERVAYDPDSGQTLTGSLMDYCLPRADDLPHFNIVFNEVIEMDNPIGAKGAGESATSGAPGAVMNALADALRSVGANPVDMPATPENVWRALRDAGVG